MYHEFQWTQGSLDCETIASMYSHITPWAMKFIQLGRLINMLICCPMKPIVVMSWNPWNTSSRALAIVKELVQS